MFFHSGKSGRNTEAALHTYSTKKAVLNIFTKSISRNTLGAASKKW